MIRAWPTTAWLGRHARTGVAGTLAIASVLAATPVDGRAAPPVHSWPMLAGSADRRGQTGSSPATIASPAWTFSRDSQDRLVNFIPQSGVVCSRDLVFAIGWVQVAATRQYSVYGIDRRTGGLRWSRPVSAPAVDSWSSPAIDESNRAVITATGKTIAAFDLLTGSPLWTTSLPRNVVNASPLVTPDLGLADRLFITQYDGFGGQGLLTCINIDPQLGLANPFAPGQVVWSAPIGGSSGNTPAYADGVVYCSAIGELDVAGSIQAFDARSRTTPAPIWTSTREGHGFYGGVSVHADALGLWLYAASYDFEGGVHASELVKLNALDGSVVWTTPCNRTSSTPVVLDDGRIILSGGIAGYGTVPGVEVFVDAGGTVDLAWDSAIDTWSDADNDASIDPGEFLPLGGWSQSPLYIPTSGRLLVGALPLAGDLNGYCPDLYILDLSLLPPLGSPEGPLDRAFIADHATGAGATPALADANIYAIGAGGVLAFGPPPARADVDGNGVVDIDDLYAWEQGSGMRDVDLNGAVDELDHTALIRAVREDESLGAPGGWR